jgi:DNA processing protein
MDARSTWFNVASAAGVGSVTFRKIWNCVEQGNIDVRELSSLDPEVMATRLSVGIGLAREISRRLADPLPMPCPDEPVRLLVAGDELHPTHRLATASPSLSPVLWVAGNVHLLRSQPSIGVAGSRDACHEAIDAAHRLGRAASDAGVTVVSGMAAGVDTAAHRGALAGRAGTVGVLASGIGRHRWDGRADDADRLCLVSEFAPDVEWTGRNAMQRNSTIAALSDRVVIVASGVRGGTWEMAHLCAKHGKPLFVIDFAERIAPGNRRLIASLDATAVSPDEIERCWLEISGVSPGGGPRTPLASRR